MIFSRSAYNYQNALRAFCELWEPAIVNYLHNNIQSASLTEISALITQGRWGEYISLVSDLYNYNSFIFYCYIIIYINHQKRNHFVNRKKLLKGPSQKHKCIIRGLTCERSRPKMRRCSSFSHVIKKVIFGLLTDVIKCSRREKLSLKLLLDLHCKFTNHSDAHNYRNTKQYFVLIVTH